MQTISARWRNAVAQSHTMAVLVEVLSSPTTVAAVLDSVNTGTVTLDARAASRGRMDLSIIAEPGSELVPTTPDSLLAPYGNELRISRGIRYPDHTLELMPLGVYRLDEAYIDDTPDGLLVQLAGLDRSVHIIAARFEDPYEIASGTNVETAILTTVQAAMPDVVSVFPGVTFTTPTLRAAEGDDRWAFVQEIATACGLSLYFDGLGRLRLAPIAGGAVVATLAEGTDGVLLHAGRRWNSTGAFNKVIATGENTGLATPVRGSAVDDNPLSPTYYGGPFGKRPRFYQSQFITTSGQATAAAAAILARELGTTQEIDFGTITDPSLEPGDTVRITRLRAGIDENHVIDGLTIPLTADTMITGSTRAQVA